MEVGSKRTQANAKLPPGSVIGVQIGALGPSDLLEIVDVHADSAVFDESGLIFKVRVSTLESRELKDEIDGPAVSNATPQRMVFGAIGQDLSVSISDVHSIDGETGDSCSRPQ